MGAVLLEVVEGNTVLYVLAGRSKLSKVEQGRPQCTVGLGEEGRVLGTLSQAEELLPQFLRSLLLRPQ